MADTLKKGITATINVPTLDLPEARTLSESFTSSADRLTKAFKTPISKEVINHRPAVW